MRWSKKRVEEVERVKRPDLESCGGGFERVEELEEEGEGEKKGGKRWGKGLRGKIFRENSGNPQTARSDKDLLRKKPLAWG